MIGNPEEGDVPEVVKVTVNMPTVVREHVEGDGVSVRKMRLLVRSHVTRQTSGGVCGGTCLGNAHMNSLEFLTLMHAQYASV